VKRKGVWPVIKKMLISFAGIFVGLCSVLYLLLEFTEPMFTQEEIDWCAANRPNITMEVCAEDFGY
jgi:hypothetical protein